MERSLREVILPMDDATVVHCGHGPSTTIARERATNPFLVGSLMTVCPDFPSCCRASASSSRPCSTGCATVFELHGFASVETPAVEPLDSLLRKGEIEKEVYVLRRLHADDDDDGAELGLHFDLTVPFARYVLEHAGHLEFPFRRYQIQKVWRGERPQQGRYREFTQADIDVIARDALPFHHDVEVARVMAEALAALDFLPPLTMQVNNRKLIEGFYLGIGAPRRPGRDARRSTGSTRLPPDVDRAAAAVDDAGLSDEQAAQCLALAEIRTPDSSFVSQVWALGVAHALLDEGLDGARRRHRRLRRDHRHHRRGGPAHRARAGLLHRDGVRDPDGRVSSRSARCARAGATTRSPPTAARPIPAWASRWASRGC